MSFIDQYKQIPYEELRQDLEELLQWAYAHGHLTLGELEKRLKKLQDCSTHEELIQLAEGLPSRVKAEESAHPHKKSSRPVEESIELFAFLSSNDRKGAWTVPKKIHCRAFLGSITLDMRQAEFPFNEIEIEGFCFLGSIDLKLPEDVEVSTSGLPLLGSISNRTRPVNPRYLVRFNGVSILGSFTARTRRRR